MTTFNFSEAPNSADALNPNSMRTPAASAACELTWPQFEFLVRELHASNQKADAYLRALPVEVSRLLFENAHAQQLNHQQELLAAAAFGPWWPDVSWFLYEWQPGFSVTCADEAGGKREYEMQSVDDYLDYAKAELFKAEAPAAP